MDNTALLEPDIRASFTAKPYTVPLPERHDTGQAIPLPGMTLTGDPPAEETEELPRAGSAVRRMEKSRRRIPLFQLFATAAGGGAGVYFALTLPEGADVSGSLFLLDRDFTEMLLHRLAWGGAFLLAEYICGYFALGWLLVWLAPLVCGLGTGAALAAAFTAGTSAAPVVIPAAVSAFVVAFAAGTSRNMSSQILQLVSSPCGVVTDSPAAGEYTLRFLVWCGIFTACALLECALRCLLTG